MQFKATLQALEKTGLLLRQALHKFTEILKQKKFKNNFSYIF